MGKRSNGKSNSAFMRPMTPSDKLAKIVGSEPLPRTEVMKRLWGYIKLRKLQDPKNKRIVRCDRNLKAVCDGRASVNMFHLTQLLNRHLRANQEAVFSDSAPQTDPMMQSERPLLLNAIKKEADELITPVKNVLSWGY